MKLHNTPLSWRKDWTLHRSKQETDRRGDPVRRYDMDNADYIGAAGTASGVAWHVASHAKTVEEYGESVSASASFLLDDAELEIAPFDRCCFGGGVWEVRGVKQRANFRTVELVAVSG